MFYWLILLNQSKHYFVASFTSENAHKIEGVSASETSKFKCTIAENVKVRTSKF